MRFVIASRPYNSKSQGCVLLHKLAHSINMIGHEASILFFDGQASQTSWHLIDDERAYNPQYKNIKHQDSESLRRFMSDAIIIYPEIITGNPLNAKYVVRYMLNREGWIKKGVLMNASERDFILTHSLNYHDNPNFHLFTYDGDKSFNRIDTKLFYQRNIDITYIGKGNKYTSCHIKENTIEVTREWPEKKEELSHLLKNCRFFYTWDCQSATNTDAILCGAFPIFLTYEPLTEREVYNAIDFNINIPKLSYKESINPLSNEKILEINEFMNSFEKSAALASRNWEENVKEFTRNVIDHFNLDYKNNHNIY